MTFCKPVILIAVALASFTFAQEIRPQAGAAQARIAFRSTRDGNWEIYATDADGTNLCWLTRNHASDDLPCFSPDGKHIVFRSERDGNQEIYIMNSEGSDQHRLTRHPGKDSNPRFSPDGTKILYAKNAAAGGGCLQ